MEANDSFLNVERLYERFNHGVDEYNNYLSSTTDIGNEKDRFLDDAGLTFGTLIEHILKHIVYYDYERKARASTDTETVNEYRRVMNFKDRNGHFLSTLKIYRLLYDEHVEDLRDLMPADSVNGTEKTAHIDQETVRGDLVNQVKHNGAIPKSEAFRKCYPEVKYLLKKFVPCDIELHEISDVVNPNWMQIYAGMNYFQSEERCYILVTGVFDNKELQEMIFRVPWSLIIDFDVKSDDENGLMEKYQRSVNRPSKVTRISEDAPGANEVVKSHLIQWFIVFLSSSDSCGDRYDRVLERRVIDQKIRDYLIAFRKVYSKPLSVLVMNCANYESSTKKIVDILDSICDGEDVDFHILSGSGFDDLDSSRYNSLTRYSFSTDEFLKCIQNHIEIEFPLAASHGYRMPGKDSAKKVIPSRLYEELIDTVEPVYFGIENSNGDNSDIKLEAKRYYQGEVKISWRMLQENVDLKREDFNLNLQEKIRKVRKSKSNTLLKLEYEAGSGATTFLRRLAYDLHRTIPTILINRYIKYETVSALHKIYGLCSESLLLIIDENDVIKDDVENLQRELYDDKLPCILVFAVRKKDSSNNKDILPRLVKEEVVELSRILIPYIPATDEGYVCKQRLTECVNLNQGNRDHIPFILCLYAFHNEFRGIESFVGNTFREAEKIDNSRGNFDTIFAIALADYAGLRVPKEYFDVSMSHDERKQLTTNRCAWFPLISYDDKSIYMRHFLFSEEILKMFSGGDLISFLKLKDNIINLIINSRRNKYQVENLIVIDFLRNMFIVRAQDVYSNRATYSHLINKMQKQQQTYSEESVREMQRAIAAIFLQLVNSYPQEEHFYGHLARYYFYELHDFSKGFDIIEQGISVAKGKNNPTGILWHIKGMGYVIKLTERVFGDFKKWKEDNRKKIEDVDGFQKIMKRIHTVVEYAEECFQKSIDTGNQGIYPHIAECNMRINLHRRFYDSANEFCVNHRYEKICPFAAIQKNLDRIDVLLDEAWKLVNDYDAETGTYQIGMLREVENERRSLNISLDETIQLCKQFLAEDCSLDYVPIYRRRLVNSYWQQIGANSSTPENQSLLRESVEYMEENIKLNPQKDSNYRLWFRAMRHLIVQDNLVNKHLDAILYKLNCWIEDGNAPVEAYYYRFVTKFIMFYEADTLFDLKNWQELQEDLETMKQRGGSFRNRTTMRDWLGCTGHGLNRLIQDKELYDMKDTNSVSSNLEKFSGHLPDRYLFESNSRTAFIDMTGYKVFFRPMRVQDRIGIANANQMVEFSLGFSFDGLRAYHDSIQLKSQAIKNSPFKQLVSLKVGDAAFLSVEGHKKLVVYGVLEDAAGKKGIMDWVTQDTREKSNCELAGYSSGQWPSTGDRIKVRLLQEREWDGGMAWQVKISMTDVE